MTITTRSGIKMNVDIDALRKHIGTKIVEHDVATQAPLRGLAVTFRARGSDPAGVASGVFHAAVAQGYSR